MTTEHPRGVARKLVDVTRGGELDPRGPSGALDVLAGERHRDKLGAVLRELVVATADMMLCRAESTGPDKAFVLDLRDDEGDPVEVDALDPPVRALVRALLARLNGQRADAEYQLDLAVRDDPRFDPVDVLVLALLWTVGSIEWCEQHDVPTPGWLG
ncbi:hypothetical protein V5P93_005244 [Actinokineospora auranticolor]|uniref:Uncharacterized protein n=1 Tax=Actinokineospora auranticolor TaxID=155976 RepID=A0A2S6GD35_9PSEU|nr:hypothetical protein [Actinokineospora auranticolor]PPK63100.1 hypothetical protein CLV40_13233 [Actinokineospora auranticolor]